MQAGVEMEAKPEGNQLEVTTSHHQGVQSQSVDLDNPKCETTEKCGQLIAIKNRVEEKIGHSLSCIIVSIVVSAVLITLLVVIVSFKANEDDTDSIADVMEVDDSVSYDIVIIGAGATGLTNLYILATSDETYKTLMVERNNRIGGRTFSNYLSYNGSSINFEMGAMRLLHWNTQSQVLSQLGLCDKIIGFEDTISYTDPSENNEEGYMLWRNHRMIYKDINSTNYWPKVFNLNDRESKWLAEGYNPANAIWEEVIEENIGFIPNTTELWDEFWDSWTLRGIPFRDWTEYAAYKTILNVSTEYWNYYTKDRLHYDDSLAVRFAEAHTSYGGWNRFSNYMGDFSLYTLSGGFGSQLDKLYDVVSEEDDNEFLFQHSVTGIEYANNTNRRYKVTMEDHEEGTTKTVYTDKVISTIPPVNLKELLPYFKPIDTETTHDLVYSVAAEVAYKISMIFDSNFWIENELNRYHNLAVTDLEISGLMIESTWTNGSLTCFHLYVSNDYGGHLWHRLQQIGDDYPMADGMEFDKMDELLVSSQLLVEEVVKQLRYWLREDDIPMPLASFSNPMGFDSSISDAWYFFKAGYVPEDVIADIIQPVDGEDIFISQSSYSKHQGWMNGAFEAAIELMETYFGIDNPFADESYCDVSGVFGDTESPTMQPTTANPTFFPSPVSTSTPSDSPTTSPTAVTMSPTMGPTKVPTKNPTDSPTFSPADNPTNAPSMDPTKGPTIEPTNGPTQNPTTEPTVNH